MTSRRIDTTKPQQPAKTQQQAKDERAKTRMRQIIGRIDTLNRNNASLMRDTVEAVDALDAKASYRVTQKMRSNTIMIASNIDRVRMMLGEYESDSLERTMISLDGDDVQAEEAVAKVAAPSGITVAGGADEDEEDDVDLGED